MDILSGDILKKHRGVSFTGVSTCFICHDGDGHIFMAQRSNNSRDERGRWDVGGGGLEHGISAMDNATKEIEEEYGVMPSAIEFLGYRDVFRQLNDGTLTHWLALDFIAHVDRMKVKIGEPEKFDDSGWFTLDALPSPLHSQVERMFVCYAAILKVKLRIEMTERS